MNDYYATTGIYEKLVQTAAMITAFAAFTMVYDSNTVSKKINTDTSNFRPNIEAILLPEEKLVVNGYSIAGKKYPDLKKKTMV